MKSNTELLNNLGNFVNRALTFCFNNYSGHVQKISVLEDAEKDLINKIDAELKTFVELMEKVKYVTYLYLPQYRKVCTTNFENKT